MLSFSSSSSSSSPSTSDPQPQQTNPNLEKEPEQEAPYNNYYTLIPSLPDHVALNCLARVPRCHHPALSLVSKPINSLHSSPLFFHTRSILHATQPFLYLHLYLSHTHSPWFTLSLNPLTTTPVPLPPIPLPTAFASYAVLASDIYVIGGSLHNIRSPHVWILDCRLHRWRQGPTMHAPRRDAAVTVINGKIYVMGECERGSSIWAKVLDPVVGSWEELVSPFVYTCTRARQWMEESTPCVMRVGWRMIRGVGCGRGLRRSFGWVGKGRRVWWVGFCVPAIATARSRGLVWEG